MEFSSVRRMIMQKPLQMNILFTGGRHLAKYLKGSYLSSYLTDSSIGMYSLHFQRNLLASFKCTRAQMQSIHNSSSHTERPYDIFTPICKKHIAFFSNCQTQVCELCRCISEDILYLDESKPVGMLHLGFKSNSDDVKPHIRRKDIHVKGHDPQQHVHLSPTPHLNCFSFNRPVPRCG